MKKTFSLLIVIALIIGMMMTTSTVVQAEGISEIEEITIDYGTPGEDYIPGQVIVCVKGGAAALAESGIFGNLALQFGFGKSNGMDSDEYDGLNGSIDGTAISIEDTLMMFEADEAIVDKVLCDNEEAEETIANKLITNNRLLASQNSDEYGIVLINCNSSDVSDLIAALQELPCVKIAEPNMICAPSSYSLTDATDEPLYNYQWYSDNKYQSGGHGIDLNAEEAYSNENFASQQEVVVAVMDSGVDYTHPDLEFSMWNDGDKYPELMSLGGGIYGINTSGDGETSDPMDEAVGHGTHCASVIASTWANKEGTAGVNGNAKIMACRWMSNDGNGIYSNYIKAMEYVIAAKEKGVNVVATNNSWGAGSSVSYATKINNLIVEAAAEKGIVSCFAAGNDNLDHDGFTNLNYHSPYYLTVGALDSAGNPAPFSDRGAASVDVFAPGTQILAATSLQEGVQNENGMPAQYLPWLQDSEDTFYFEDFEDFENRKICLSSYMIDEETNEKSEFVDENSVREGYLSPTACQVALSSEISANDMIGIELKLDNPFSEILDDEGNLIEDDQYYMALQAGNDSFTGDRNYTVEYCSVDEGIENWEVVGEFDVTDGNWNVYSKKIKADTIMEMINATKTTEDKLRLRLTMHVSSIAAGANVYIDCVGFGTEPSNYYYSDGTSMATPCVTAVASLLAGSGAPMEDEEDVLKLIARIKGGVKRTESLTGVCTTMGVVQADTAYKTEAELFPVPQSVEVSEDGSTAIISGYFFGSETGLVSVNGRPASITSWSDNQIKITIPNDTEYGFLEYSVTRNDNKNGRNFGVFVSSQTTKLQYESLEAGNFTYGELKTKDMLPLRMAANEEGIMTLMVSDTSDCIAFEFYSFGTGNWEQIPLPEETEIDQNYLQLNYSLVGGKDQFYLLAPVKKEDGTSRLHLMTYSTSEKRWIYNAELHEYNKAGAFLGIDKDGKLYIAGGLEGISESGISQIYPDTGNCTLIVANLPEGVAMFSGGDYLISGDTQILAGLSHQMLNVFMKGGPALPPYVLKDGVWSQQTTPFYDADEETEDGLGGAGLDKGQVHTGAYGALDSGFIFAGPARGIGTTNMVDTWIYNAANDTYTALEARVDTRKVANITGTCHDGKFYIMGRSGVTGDVFFKSLDLAKAGVVSTDNVINAETEPANYYLTGIGSTWFNEQGEGYFIVDESGNLTKEGASLSHYDVAYDSASNKITFNNLDIKMNNIGTRASGKHALIYSDRNLIIELKGASSISGNTADALTNNKSFGIYCKGDITFTGDGNLDLKSGVFGKENVGIYSEKSITFNHKGSINISGNMKTERLIDFLQMSLQAYSEITNAPSQPIRLNTGTYGIFAKGKVDIERGKVNVLADSLLWDSSVEVGENVELSFESIGIDANDVSVSGDSGLTVRSGDVSAEGGLQSIGIRTKEPVKISESEISILVGKLSDSSKEELAGDAENTGNSKNFTVLPILTDGIKASIWFGNNEKEALEAGEKPFNKISENLGKPYLLIKASLEKKEETPTDPKTGDSSDMGLWIIVAIVAGLGITFCVFSKFRKRSR